MMVRLDLVLAEGEVDVRLKIFAASVDVADGRDRNRVVVFVSRGVVRHGGPPEGSNAM